MSDLPPLRPPLPPRPPPPPSAPVPEPPGEAAPREASPAGQLTLVAWCLYDWANSAFPTVIVTFVFAAYYTRAVAPTPEQGTGDWGFAISLSGLAIALLAPVFGAIADQGGPRKPGLALFTAVAVLAAAALWWIAPGPEDALFALVLVAVANAAFELGQSFYNAMLPELAGPGRLGRLSGWAWALGYAGGLVCLLLTLVIFVQPDPPLFGLDAAQSEQVRIVGPFVAAWFGLFALPLFFFVPDRPSLRRPLSESVRLGFASLVETLRGLPARSDILRFLIARMIYIDGLNTLFAFGGIYAAGSFGMDFEQILLFGVVLNVAAGLGALAFSWIDDWLGAKPTVLFSVVCVIGLSTAILLVETTLWFYVLGSGIGIFIGPVQSASRSLMARLAPAEIRTEMFGLYALTGKATAFVGPALVGWVTLATDSQRWGMATILIFFVVGFALLWPLKAPR